MQVQGSDDESLRLVAAQLLELLADVKSPEDMVDRRFDIGMDGLIHLSVVENEPVQVDFILDSRLRCVATTLFVFSVGYIYNGRRSYVILSSGWPSRLWWTWHSPSQSGSKSSCRRCEPYHYHDIAYNLIVLLVTEMPTRGFTVMTGRC